jgi:uncharacterized protein YeeX (DUF496 family)
MCPNELKEKFNKIIEKNKNNRKPGNKLSYEKDYNEAKGSKNKKRVIVSRKLILHLLRKINVTTIRI